MNRLFASLGLLPVALCVVTALSHHAVYAEGADKFYARTAPSVWRVRNLDSSGKEVGLGSAVVVQKGALLTNCHVIKNAVKVELSFGHQRYPAILEHIDIERDLCQLRSNELPASPVSMGDSTKLVVGQKIYTIGNPRGLERTLSDGLISALRYDTDNQLSFIQISAPISPGSSGGGLFDENGNLIGITTALVRDAQNLNLVIPINWYKDLPERSRAALAAYQANNTPRVAPSPPTSGGRNPEPPLSIIASGFADLNDIAKLDQFGARKGYEQFLRTDRPRAFAIVEGGTGYWISNGNRPRNPSSSSIPHVRITKDCEERYKKTCYLYAVDDVVVYKPVSNNMAYTGPTPIPVASGYADISDVNKLSKFGVKQGYEDFLNRAFPRAFAITDDGRYFFSNGLGAPPNNPNASIEPHVRILPECENRYSRRCYLYAVNGVVVFQPPKALQ
jgi:serine protease Do